jgi:hypothetical protein
VSKTRTLRRALRTRLKHAGGVLHWLVEGPMGTFELWTQGGRRLVLQALPADGGLEVFELATDARVNELLGNSAPEDI